MGIANGCFANVQTRKQKHVFLRMNIVGEHQACHFVHQNLGAFRCSVSLCLKATSIQLYRWLDWYIWEIDGIKFIYGVLRREKIEKMN